MHFLILTQYFPPETGAPQIRLAAVIRELQRQGHSAEIVTALPNYPHGRIFAAYRGHFYQQDSWENCRVHRVWMYAALGAGLKRILNYTSFMLTAGWGLWHVQQKPDYVFVESPPLFLGITGYLAARYWRVPLIFNIADLWPDFVKGIGLMKQGFTLWVAERLEAWIYRRADFINVVTLGVKDILINEKKVPEPKILFLPNGADTDTFHWQPPDTAWQASLGLADKPIIVYAGTHGYAHGMEVILAAAQLLQDTALVFLLVGGGSDKARMQTLCASLELKNVIFWDSQPPAMIAQLYGLAVAGIATLRPASGLGHMRLAKLLAIMACGKPVLYSGGAGEGANLVQTAEAGWVTPAGDAAALVAAIKTLMANPAIASQRGANGRRYIEQHLQWSAVVSTWLHALEEASASVKQ